MLLKASNSDGVWNETPVRINVTVIPPFWQTTWFRVMLTLAVVAIVAGGVRLRTKAIHASHHPAKLSAGGTYIVWESACQVPG